MNKKEILEDLHYQIFDLKKDIADLKKDLAKILNLLQLEKLKVSCRQNICPSCNKAIDLEEKINCPSQNCPYLLGSKCEK